VTATRRMGLRAKFHPSCDTAHAKLKRSNTFSRPACRVFGCYGEGFKICQMSNYTQKAKELKAQFGDNAKYVVSEIVDALKVTTGHLTIKPLLERQELQMDFDFWSDVKSEIERIKSESEKKKICYQMNCGIHPPIGVCQISYRCSAFLSEPI